MGDIAAIFSAGSVDGFQQKVEHAWNGHGLDPPAPKAQSAVTCLHKQDGGAILGPSEA
ncbi:MAG TPA: hypothetical protein VII95_06285 [Terriglobales bacterium]